MYIILVAEYSIKLNQLIYNSHDELINSLIKSKIIIYTKMWKKYSETSIEDYIIPMIIN